MPSTGQDYNATVWVRRQGVTMACFPATVTEQGALTATPLMEFDRLHGNPDTDRLLREQLASRYGDSTVQVVRDGGSGFRAFQRALAGANPPSAPPPYRLGRRRRRTAARHRRFQPARSSPRPSDPA